MQGSNKGHEAYLPLRHLPIRLHGWLDSLTSSMMLQGMQRRRFSLCLRYGNCRRMRHIGLVEQGLYTCQSTLLLMQLDRFVPLRPLLPVPIFCFDFGSGFRTHVLLVFGISRNSLPLAAMFFSHILAPSLLSLNKFCACGFASSGRF